MSIICQPKNPLNLRSLRLSVDVGALVANGLVSYAFPLNSNAIIHHATVVCSIFGTTAGEQAVLFQGFISRGGTPAGAVATVSGQNIFAPPIQLQNVGGSTGIVVPAPNADQLWSMALKSGGGAGVDQGINVSEEFSHYMTVGAGDALAITIASGAIAPIDAQVEVNLLIEFTP